MIKFGVRGHLKDHLIHEYDFTGENKGSEKLTHVPVLEICSRHVALSQ